MNANFTTTPTTSPVKMSLDDEYKQRRMWADIESFETVRRLQRREPDVPTAKDKYLVLDGIVADLDHKKVNMADYNGWRLVDGEALVEVPGQSRKVRRQAQLWVFYRNGHVWHSEVAQAVVRTIPVAVGGQVVEVQEFGTAPGAFGVRRFGGYIFSSFNPVNAQVPMPVPVQQQPQELVQTNVAAPRAIAPLPRAGPSAAASNPNATERQQRIAAAKAKRAPKAKLAPRAILPAPVVTIAPMPVAIAAPVEVEEEDIFSAVLSRMSQADIDVIMSLGSINMKRSAPEEAEEQPKAQRPRLSTSPSSSSSVSEASQVAMTPISPASSDLMSSPITSSEFSWSGSEVEKVAEWDAMGADEVVADLFSL